MPVRCDSCGNDTFTGIERDYHGGCWLAECAECGDNLVINEEL